MLRGIIKHDELNDVSSTMTDWSTAMKIDPDSIKGLQRLSKTYEQDKRKNDGNYKYANRYYQRGILKYQKNDGIGALSDLSTALDIAGGGYGLSSYAGAYYYIGLVNRNKLNDRKGAIDAFQKAIRAYKDRGDSVGVQLATTQIDSMKATKDELHGPLTNYGLY